MLENDLYVSESFYFSWDRIGDRPEPLNVVLASPEYFDIVDVKNAHMEGNAGRLDKKKAHEQWNGLLQHYFNLKARGIIQEVKVIAGAEGCEDMVFAANQSFPWISEEGEKIVVMSRMKHPSRQREITHFENFYQGLGYIVLPPPGNFTVEGMGDMIPVPGKRLLLGGYGHRTEVDALKEIARLLQVPVIGLELADERFYHLDTCCIPLDKDTVIYCADAFGLDGLRILHKLFKNHIRIPASEAIAYFSLNAHYIPSTLKKVAVLEKSSAFTYMAFRNLGIEVLETETSEFMKSGGSVFCMKMMYY
jgi:N-dimethylarginine dimethylaminohydrolase